MTTGSSTGQLPPDVSSTHPRNDTEPPSATMEAKQQSKQKTPARHGEARPSSNALQSSAPGTKSVGSANDTNSLETMKKRMSEALAQKQQQKQKRSGTTPPAGARTGLTPIAGTGSSKSMGEEGAVLSGGGTVSTDSARTVRAAYELTPGTVQTPSYPFPRMQLKLQRGISQRSGPHHKPFTLLSPTNEPPKTLSYAITPGRRASSELSTPQANDPTSQSGPEDLEYPTPDLYDMVLMLNTQPGLDSWWVNATEILAEAYGAERASLALPGDITDLENVPWGLKATFNVHGSESSSSYRFDSALASEDDDKSQPRLQENNSASGELLAFGRRPLLETRHSIAGNQPDSLVRMAAQRPEAPARSTSYAQDRSEQQNDTTPRPRLTQPSPVSQSIPTLDETRAFETTHVDPSLLTSSPRCHVWRSLQPLEAEADALLARDGVSPLFGKRKPVILTRTYAEEHVSHKMMESRFGNDVFGLTDKTSRPPNPRATLAPSFVIPRPFDEFEQPEPSLWSQSPSPSPAARADPVESVFFTQGSGIDEGAFDQNPPSHNYGASANQSLSAIGTDLSKTLVQIPLIQPVPTRSMMQAGLRFPIAILSFLTPVNPYPRNLRYSLATLLPHLASTFSLAQQYTALQDRLRGGPLRRSAAFGLGGTFSDEGSELELVSELCSQLILDRDKLPSPSLYGSNTSPMEDTGPRGSATNSLIGTPLMEHLAMHAGVLSTPGRAGTDLVDSYFSARRQRASQSVNTPSVKLDDTPDKSKRSETAAGSRSAAKRSNPSVKPAKEQKSPATAVRTSTLSSSSELNDPLLTSTSEQPSVTSRRQASLRDSAIKSDTEKPLPELISSLMLNAVPLQLFLAKPTSGDLVWTNRKFDAFRSQGETRVRDPWKNVHGADRDSLLQHWNEALKTGSQFTHYVRVNRFNSDFDFRWFVFRASTLLSNSGRLLYWIGSFLDVHEQYMKVLESSEKETSMARDAKIRALADAIPQILFEAIEGEGIVSVNQQWHTFSGQTLEEARGLGFARQVHRDDLYRCGTLSPQDPRRQPARNVSDSSSSDSSTQTAHAQPGPNALKSIFTPDSQSLDQMLRQGAMVAETDENGRTSYSTEIRLKSQRGEYRWHLIRLVKTQHELLNGGRASWYGTCTDIEARMGLERELNQANKKVNQEMESKTKFFANMSHEIRTPLNGILGSMPWLIDSVLDHDQRRTVDTIQNSANNLRELVDNLLDVTKVEAGKMTLLPKWFSVRSLCEEVVDTVSSRAIERGLELNYSLDVDVPSTVRGDPFRIRQVLLNLMGNSVKFTEQGEVFLHCHLKDQSFAEDDAMQAQLKFDVVDTGRGFNEIEFKRLFKQFGQIEGASQHESGSGLGLFLSKQLVEMHGGELSVTSKTGEGSTFSFYVTVELSSSNKDLNSPRQAERPVNRQSASYSSLQTRLDGKAPTMPSSKAVVYTPGLSRYSTAEPRSPSLAGVTSSPMVSPTSSIPSGRSNSGNAAQISSSISSLVPTPESGPGQSRSAMFIERQTVMEPATKGFPLIRRSKSDNDGKTMVSDQAYPEIYSIIVICPVEYARAAIKQHIEHVVPHSIPANVTTLPDVASYLELMRGPTASTFTHIVLDLPASSDIMLFMRQTQDLSGAVMPTLVVITDHYQKRDIQEDFSLLTSTGRRAFLVHKPVKPSVFAVIFDPAQLRNLSKDRAREVAQTSSDDFKKIANRVCETIGNKAFKILLVEDSDVNRMVIMRYLKRVGLESEEARDGQECVDKVSSKPQGYYSLIICDIQMPVKNGYEACAEIRAWEASHGYDRCPIMALTANAMPEERAAATSAGFSDYLTKPVDFNQLGRMMIDLLSSRSRVKTGID